MTDWQARAEREAAAIIDGCPRVLAPEGRRDLIVSLLAIAWLQGASVGLHETLAAVEVGFEQMRATL